MDAGPSCGAGFVKSPRTTDRITILGRREFADTEMGISRMADGSTVSVGNGDKCAWISPGPGAASEREIRPQLFACAVPVEQRL
jgi:hypothetical protein